MSRKIIGEGAYGCVHKPSIQCKTQPASNFDYSNYVSKFMRNNDAEKELREFVVIGNYDPNNEFHLGTPLKCKPKLTPDIIDDVKNCKYVDKNDLTAQPDIYSLLLIKYGGPDLASFCKNFISDYLKTNKNEKSDDFWIEAHHLLKGLKFFKDNNIVHHDIKPQNILFNPDNGKLMYIDFGLMNTKNKIIEKSKDSTNSLAVFHWSYPFDTGFMNKYYYNYYKTNKSAGTRFKNIIERLIINGSPNNSGFPMKRPDSFKLLFKYIEPDGKEPSKTKQYAYISSFFTGFDDFMKNKNYDQYLNNSVDSIDIFGLGFTLQFILNCFKKANAVDDDFYNKASALFAKMYDFNPSTRELDIDNILSEYENILLATGILTRRNKNFRNHDLLNISPLPPSIKQSDSKTTSMTEFEATLNALELKDFYKCPDDKELNLNTRRCVKKCGPGYVRNPNFRCVKQKKPAPPKPKPVAVSRKSCPENKDLNPKTKRCVKKCDPGYIRNSDFKCVKTRKISTSKSKTISRKKCSDNKELNPKTNRCINKCKQGYSRNAEFKCVKSNSINYGKVAIT
jgi:serine/threonine protein kinase